MREEWLALREKLLFSTPVEEFEAVWQSAIAGYKDEFRLANDGRKNDIASILVEICIDIQSYLKRWHIQKPGAALFVSDMKIKNFASEIAGLLSLWGYTQKTAYIEDEIISIQKSGMMNLSILTDRGILNNRWGNDYASGLAEAMRKGAILATTNPLIVNIERKEDPDRWDAVKNRLKAAKNILNKEHESLDVRKLASLMSMQVVLKNCRELRPVFKASDGRLGYVCLQVDPGNSSNSVGMVEEAEYLYEQLGKELGGTPNVLFKLPGTKASLTAAAVLTQKGIGVTITLSFSVDQMEAFAEIIENGCAKVSYVVMMMGRLDDPVRDELMKYGQEGSAEAAKFASTAIVKKAYDILYIKRKFRKSMILAASLRGPWNIYGALTDGEVSIIITSFPDKTKEYDSVERQPESHINDTVPVDIIDRLMKSGIFRQAYVRGALLPEDFDSYHPVEATLSSFKQSYNDLISYLEK